MQVMSARFGYDAGSFGRFGIRNWDVSSLTDRRDDAHRHALYHDKSSYRPAHNDWTHGGIGLRLRF